MTANQGSTTMRNVPDVALTAENVYVRADGADYNVGGTSCAAPLWAGFAALINQQAVSVGQPLIGFVNPLVYAIGAKTNYTSVFHDTTTGDNTSPSSPTKFYAVPGYDLCTGWGTPAGQRLIDVLAPPLIVTLPASATEGDGLLPDAGQIQLPAVQATDVIATLSSSDPTQVSVPASVTVSAGQTNGAFDLTILDAGVLDGTQIATVSASVPGVGSGSANMMIFDKETTALQVLLPATVTKGQGAVSGAVRVGVPVGANVTVALSSDTTNLMQVPASVIIPSGQTSAVFTAIVLTDGQINGGQTVKVAAHVQNWTDGLAAIAVQDNINLAVALPASAWENAGVLTNAGLVSLAGVSAADTVIALTSSNPSKLIVPANVTVPAGSLSNRFDITPVDDPLVEGHQLVTVTASATGFANGSASMWVLDKETPPFPFNPRPANYATNVPANTNLMWSNGNIGDNQFILNGDFETGTFTDWIKTNSTTYGDWVINNGTYVPPGPGGASPPFAGSFSALSEQTGGGAHTLYQDITIPSGVSLATLSWADCIRNFASQFTTNSQYFHVEIRRTDDSLLQIAFTTKPGDPLVNNWVARSFDLSPYIGQTIRLAFVELDTLNYFNVGLDNVSVQVSTPVTNNLGAITNDVYFGTNPTPGPAEFQGSTTNSSWTLPLLAPLTTYYWQIAAHRVGSATGAVWQFTTAGVDHFAWGAIPTPQLVNQPFSTTIAAQDVFGTTVTNFTGTVSLQCIEGGGMSQTFEDFESGIWPHSPWVSVSGTTPGTISPAYAHDGNYGLSDPEWMYRTDVSLGKSGDGLSWWVRPGTGRAYLGFGASSSGCWSIVAAPNTGEFILQQNSGYDFSSVVTVSQTWQNGKWYRVAVQFTSVSSVTCNLYDSDGTTLLNSLTYANVTGLPGGIAMRSFSTFALDTITTGGVDGTVSCSPTNTGNFINGMWNGSITVQQPATNVALRADDGSHHSGISNPFDVDLMNDLSIAIADSPHPVSVGANLTYTLTVANTGPADATGVMVTNLLPASATFVSVTASQGTGSQTGGLVTCNLGVVSGGTNATITIVVVPTIAGTTLTNTATVSRGEADAYLGNNTAATLTPVTTPAISIADASGLEGNVGTTNLVFAVTLAVPSAQNITVNYATADGTASAGKDYISTNGIVTFAPGVTNQSVMVAVVGNAIVEPNKTFFVNLSNPVNGTLGRSQAVGTIINDDGLPGQVDHFVWNPIASPQYVNQPFAVTVSALDYSNNVVTNFTGTVALSAMGGSGGSLTNILLFEYVNQHYFLSALNELGLNYQAFGPGGEAAFNAAVSSADVNTTLVVFDVASSFSDFGPITTFVNSGGHAIFAFWALDQQPAVAAAFDVSVVSYYFTPQPVYNWGNSQLFAGLPNPFVLVQGGWGINGDLLNPIAGGTAVAGYTSNPASNQAALVIGNSGRTILNGFLVDNAQTGSDAVQFAENEIQMLLSGSQLPIPITPTVSGAFSNGVWGGALTVLSRATNTVLAAGDDNGHVGSSNPIDVEPFNMPPVVLTQPASQTNFVHSSATITVAADGTSPLTYQWNFSGTNLPGATNASLTLTNLQYIQAGIYFVQVTNAFGAVTSSNAVLVVASHPPVAVPDTVTFLVGATQVSFNVLNNDSDVDGDPLTVQSFTLPTRGTLTQINNGQFAYQPGAEFTSGLDQFNYTITDGHGGTATTSVTIVARTRYLDGGDWPTFGNGPSHTGYYPGMLGGSTLVAGWSTNFGSALNQVAVGGGNVYVTPVTYFGATYLTALNAASGQSAWQYNFASAFSINPPTFDNGSVYVQRGDAGSDSQLWCINAADGSVTWSAPFGAQWERYYAPTVYGNGIWVDGGYFGGMYGFGTNGTQWFFNNGLEQYDQWTPTYYQGTVYSWVAGNFRAHDPLTGTVLWMASFGWNWDGWSMNTVSAIDGGRAFVQQRPNLIAIDLTTHTNAWIVTGGVKGSPAVAKGIVYAIIGDGVRAFSAQDGTSLGVYEATNDTGVAWQPIVTDDALFISSSSATYIFDLASHQLLQTIPYGGQLSMANGWLYIAGQDGWLRCYYIVGNGVPANLTVTPSTALNASGPVGGPFNSSNMVYTLSNGGTNALNWSAGCSQLWVPVLTNSSPDSVRAITINSPQGQRFFRAKSFTIGAPPLLSAPSYAAGQFQFTLSGQTNTTYIIEELTDWQTPGWVTVSACGGSLLPGASTNVTVLINTNACSLSNGVYTATVTFRNLTSGAAQTRGVQLTVSNPAPSILIQPTNQTVTVGDAVSFSVTASGMPPLSYQWSFNGTNIVGAANSTLTLTNVQPGQAGNYEVLVTNAYGSVFSSNAVLTVNPLPPCAPVSSGLVSWWPGEDNANDVVGTNKGTLQGGVSFAAGEVGEAFVFDGSTASIKVPASLGLTVGAGNGLTIETWVCPAADTLTELQSIMEWNAGSGSQPIGSQLGMSVFYDASLYANLLDTAGTGHLLNSDAGLMTTNFQHIAVTYDKTTGVAVLYRNGVVVTTANLGIFTPQTTYDFYIGARPAGPFANHFNGMIDEPSIYNRVLSAVEIQSIYNAGSGGKCPPTLPVIVSQPTNQTVMVGGAAIFSVTASGTPPLSYQWNFNGTNIAGATNTTLTLTNVQLNQAGNYAVLVTNVYGSALSSNAALTVNLPASSIPVITGFSPNSGTVGTIVTITGTNFSPVASNNIVYFGAVRATVTAATGTNLVVTVPTGATYAPITETVNGLTAFANSLFLPTFAGVGVFNSNSLSGPVILSAGSGPSLVVIKDLDGDGKPDVVVANVYDGTVYLYRNISTNGILAFTSPVIFTIGGGNDSLWGLAVADLEGDGRPDIVVANRNYNNVSIFQNFCTPGNITSNSFGTRLDLPVAGMPRSVVVADLDGDGKPDIITVDQASNVVSVLKNIGTSGIITTNSFAAPVNFAVGLSPVFMAIADLDGDGKPDVVTINFGDNNNAVSVLRNISNAGNIAFAPAVNFPGLPNSFNLAIGDLDRDGKLDLVVSSFSGGQAVSVYRNVSTPGSITTNSFAARVDFAVDGWANGAAIGDLDGDGKPDVAVVTQLPDHLSIFKNVSTPGSFTTNSLAAKVNFSAGYNPNGVVIGDLDGDGRSEVVFGNTYDGTVSIYQNAVSFGGAAPVIVSHPTNQTTTVGGTANFGVTASGTPPLSYQWNFNGTNIAGATNTSLTLTNVQFSQAGNYAVLVTNVYGSVLSSNASLTVTPDHFAWNTIPSPRYVNTPFPVAIQARDLANGLFTNFTGTAILSTTNGIAVAPPVSGNFIQGVWTGSVTIAQTGSSLVLQASDGLGHLGWANPINVINLPQLGMLCSGNIAVYMWPVQYSGFVLETSSSLSPPTWIVVPYAPIRVGDEYLLPLDMTGTNGFYRLWFPGP